MVYCHTNIVNNKKYIGITCQKLNQRFRNGNGYKSSPHFYNAICKYGWDSFEHIILFENLTLEEAKQKEIENISKYQTSNEKYGYNMTPGGEAYCGEDNPWFGRHHTEETKRKMSEKRKGMKHTKEWNERISKALKGRKFSEETRKKMSLNHADFSGKNSPMYGRKIPKEQLERMIRLSKTPEAIEKMKRNKVWYSGAKNPNAKKIICLDNGKVYGCIKDAANDLNCNPSKISDVLHGRRKHTGNYHFRFVEE